MSNKGVATSHMPAKKTGQWSSKNVQSRAATRVVSHDKTTHGRDAWHVTSDGRSRTVITSPTSAAAINEAAVIYAAALKRLAKR